MSAEGKAAAHASEVIGRLSFNITLRVLGIPKIYDALSPNEREEIENIRTRLNRIVTTLRNRSNS